MHWKVGDVRITQIVELTTDSISGALLPQATKEALAEISWLGPPFLGSDGLLVLSIHALVVESQGQRLVVDTCLGKLSTTKTIVKLKFLQVPEHLKVL